MDLLFRNCINHKVNSILILRGGYLSKDHCGDFLPHECQHKQDFMETLLFKNIIFGTFKRPLLRFPALCQHKSDMMETIVQKCNPIVHHEQ